MRVFLLYGPDEQGKRAFLDSLLVTIAPQFVHECGIPDPIGINDVRQIQRKAYLTSPHSRQVFLLHRADVMTREASNALLKILEEPPASSIFILIAQNTHTLPRTILSRVSRHPFFATQEGDMHTSDGIEKGEGREDAAQFFYGEIARLKTELEEYIRQHGIVKGSVFNSLALSLKLASSLASLRTPPKYLLDIYALHTTA